jgi:hypothetical protein
MKWTCATALVRFNREFGQVPSAVLRAFLGSRPFMPRVRRLSFGSSVHRMRHVSGPVDISSLTSTRNRIGRTKKWNWQLRTTRTNGQGLDRVFRKRQTVLILRGAKPFSCSVPQGQKGENVLFSCLPCLPDNVEYHEVEEKQMQERNAKSLNGPIASANPS